MTRYKEQKFTILNSRYFEILEALSSGFQERGIPYALVGGAAFQTKIGFLLSDEGKYPISSVKGLEGLLRSTGDIDLATLSDLPAMINFFNELAATYTHLCIENRAEKSASAKVDDNGRVFINYQTEPQDLRGLTSHYREIINTADSHDISHKNRNMTISVPRSEYLVVSKLLRLNEKDKFDINSLLLTLKNKKISINLEEIRAILKSISREDKFDYIKQVAYDFHL